MKKDRGFAKVAAAARGRYARLGAVLGAVVVLAVGGAAISKGHFPLGVGGSDCMPDQTDKRPCAPTGPIQLGAYDPHGDFGSDPHVEIEHLFLPWEDVDLSQLRVADAYARERDRRLLISVEPWSWVDKWRLGPQELLDAIMSGEFDANIDAVCRAIGDLEAPVTVRWAQEMEDSTGPFPWAAWNPEGYRAAYRVFVTRCREHVEDADYMWSPKGQKGLAAYYPGDDVVDKIGLPAFGLQPYDKAIYGRSRTFADVLKPAYKRVADFGKPVYVAELGYEGDADYVESWARSVTETHAAFPDLVGVIYFNDLEPHPWPGSFGWPNWRVVQGESG